MGLGPRKEKKDAPSTLFVSLRTLMGLSVLE